MNPVATVHRDCAAAIKSIKFDRKTGYVSEVVLADKVGVASFVQSSIGVVNDETVNSIDRLGERLDRAISRVGPEERALADALEALAGGSAGTGDGIAPALERSGEDRVARNGPSRASMHRGRTMGKHRLGFIAFDSTKEKHAVAIADAIGMTKCAIWVRSTNEAARCWTTRQTNQPSLSPSRGASIASAG